MRKVIEKCRLWGLLLLLTVFAAGIAGQVSSQEVQAAKTGFIQKGSNTYYVDADGSYHKGWLYLTENGKKKTYYFSSNAGIMAKGWLENGSGGKRYFDPETGVMTEGWHTDAEGNMRYFTTGSGLMLEGWHENSAGSMRYFYNGSGIMAKGWVENGSGSMRYFNSSTGIMTEGWHTDTQGNKRYFTTGSGLMLEGWATNSAGSTRYFYNGTGIMAEGWVENGSGGLRYFTKNSGIMAVGWVKNSSGDTRYFTSGGLMATNWVNDSKGNKRYFDPSTGIMATGWKDIDGKRYYLDPDSGYMATGTVTIDGTQYIFEDDGVLIGEADGNTADLTAPTSERTIKNYLKNALMPVGSTLYVWGGGWAQPTSTYKGLYPKWKEWYNSNGGDYDYNDYKDLSITTRAKGLDCSGFVGWSTYNVMQTESGIGSGYASDATGQAASYADRGWGTLLTQQNLKKNNYIGQFKAGDVGSRYGHAWIVLGQCNDGSLVIVHSTPPCVQIAGTPTPSGDWSSEATALAKKYMRTYYAGTVNKFGLGSQTSLTCINASNVMRWNSSVLADPDGYTHMTAEQILADLFTN